MDKSGSYQKEVKWIPKTILIHQLSIFNTKSILDSSQNLYDKIIYYSNDLLYFTNY